MRSNGTAKELEAGRRLAAQRVEDGWTQRQEAAFLGAHPVAVGKRMARFRAKGEDGLAATPTPGRPPLLTAAQEKTVRGWRADPPTAHGLRTDLWAARRVADRIHKRLNPRSHPHDLREWLAKRNDSPQKPARRAKQQNPAEVGRWVTEEWPRAQTKSQPSRPTSSGSTPPGGSSTGSSAGRGRCGARRRSSAGTAGTARRCRRSGPSACRHPLDLWGWTSPPCRTASSPPGRWSGSSGACSNTCGARWSSSGTGAGTTRGHGSGTSWGGARG